MNTEKDKYQFFLNKLQNSTESERDWLVMEFSLEELSDTLQKLVWSAAIPHWFDRDFLYAVSAISVEDKEFQDLTELSFVEVNPDRGFNIHEHSRNLLLKNLWANDKKEYRKLNQRAATYCQQQDQENFFWWVETIYQRIVLESKSTDYFFNVINKSWDSFQYEKIEMLLRVTNENETNSDLMENRLKIMENIVIKIENEIKTSNQENRQFLASMIEQLPEWSRCNNAQNLIRNLIKINYFKCKSKIYSVPPIIIKMIKIRPFNLGEIISEALPLIHELEEMNHLKESFIAKFAKKIITQVPNILEHCHLFNELINTNIKSTRDLIIKLIWELLSCDVEIKAKLLKSEKEIGQTISGNKQLFQNIYG